MTKIKGWDLEFFNSGEWQVCDERLKDLEKVNKAIGSDGYNPGREKIFSALRATPYTSCKVCIVGQDPYPQQAFATGLAFSIPELKPKKIYDGSKQVQSTEPEVSFPVTLQTFLKEYSTDLGLPIPRSGNLGRWAESGVLLWNAIPSCLPGKSLSHDWDEWSYLTKEIIVSLAKKGIVFALLGQVARRYINYISPSNNYIICTSHPSPRGSINSKTPFLGSRLFSTINARLVENGQEPIDWRL